MLQINYFNYFQLADSIGAEVSNVEDMVLGDEKVKKSQTKLQNKT